MYHIIMLRDPPFLLQHSKNLCYHKLYYKCDQLLPVRWDVDRTEKTWMTNNYYTWWR